MKSRLTIDLGIIKSNYKYLCSKTKAKVGASIKGNAYGLGATKVAPALYDAGCRDFFAVHIEEGIELRKVIPEGNVYVLNGPEEKSLKIHEEYSLTAVLNRPDQIDLWNKAKLNCNSIIHLDTGLTRYGLKPQELDSLDKLPHNLEYIISHLSCGDELEHEYNKFQLEKFKKHTDTYNVKRSLAASGGIFQGEEYHFDLVRPGGILYGTCHIPDPNLKNPITLEAPIININNITEDCYVGYDCKFQAKGGSKLATIVIGYADGLQRATKEKGFVYINGQKAPIANSISMDLSVVDATGIDCQIGDMVEIIGPNQLPGQLAEYSGSISYEILNLLKCGRFDRVYI